MNATSTKQVTITNATSFDSIGTFLSLTKGIAGAVTGLTIVNTCIAQLREAKITFGKSVKTCIYRAQLADAMRLAFPDKSDKTWMNYATSVISAVNDGTEFSLSGSKGTKKSSAVTGTAPKQGRENPALDALFKCLKIAGGLDVLYMMQEAYDNAEGSLVEIAIDLLKAEGYEITAE
jgi:hypothetical protein